MDEKKQLKILIVSQYFWPENFRVNDIVKYFQNQGAHVEKDLSHSITTFPLKISNKILSTHIQSLLRYRQIF